MVKLFQFPSFEEWCSRNREFKQKIGEFTCVFHPTCWRLNSSITRYECAIACSENPTNVYVHTVVNWSFECDSTDTELVRKRYTEAIREVHARWINYIENNYTVSNGAFCPEYISLTSIVISALCVSNKKELSLEEINQLLETIHNKIHVNGELIAFVDIPEHVDSKYLEQVMMQGYSYFRLSKNYEGIVLKSDVNPSQLYFHWEIKNNTVLSIIKGFYNQCIED